MSIITDVNSIASTLASFTLPTAIRLGKRCDLNLEDCETDEEKWLENDSPWSSDFACTVPNHQTRLSFMKFSMDKISKGAQTLLVLTSLCDGPLPEEIIQILWRRVKSPSSDLASMSSFRDELEEQEWLDVKSHNVLLWSVAESRSTWIIASLQKKYVSDNMVDARRFLFQSLLEETDGRDQEAGIVQDRETITICLCTLYFDVSLAENTVRKLGISTTRYNELKKIRSWIVDPLLWLLRNINNNSKEWFGSSGVAMKVFLSYISCEDDEHDAEAVRLLLALPSSKETTYWILVIIAMITQKLLIAREKYTATYEHNVLKPLVDLVAGVEWSKTPEDSTGWALSNISSLDHHRVVMAALPGLVEGLVGSLARISYPLIKISSLITLADLALDSRHTVRRKIFEFPDALPALLESISTDECYIVQMHAASVLERISLDSSIAKSIGSKTGALHELVEVLFRAKGRSLQAKVATVLSTVAVVQDQNLASIREQIAQSPGVLPALVRLLCEAEDRNIQSQAALTLAMLSTDEKDSASTWKRSLSINGDFASKISDILIFNPDAFLQLVLLLYEEESPEVQGNAARVLNNISSTCEKLRQEFIQGVMPEYDNVIVHQLVNLLSVNRNPYAQTEAARLLALVGDASDEHEFVIGMKLANSPKVFPILVLLMHTKETPNLPQLATVLFYFTARAMHKESMSMAPMEEVKEGLLHLLANDHIGSGSPYISAYALTLLDPEKAGTLSLSSEDAFEGRADAYAELKMCSGPAKKFAELDLAVHQKRIDEEYSQSSSRLSVRVPGYAETDTDETSSRTKRRARNPLMSLTAAREKFRIFSQTLTSFGSSKHKGRELVEKQKGLPRWSSRRSHRKSRFESSPVSRQPRSRGTSLRAGDIPGYFAISRAESRTSSRAASRAPSNRVVDFPGDYPISISPYRYSEYESVS